MNLKKKKDLKITNVGEDVEKLKPLYSPGENVKWYTTMEKSWQFLRRYRLTNLSSNSIPLSRILFTQKNWKQVLKDFHTNFLSTTVHSSQKE